MSGAHQSFNIYWPECISTPSFSHTYFSPHYWHGLLLFTLALAQSASPLPSSFRPLSVVGIITTWKSRLSIVSTWTQTIPSTQPRWINDRSIPVLLVVSSSYNITRKYSIYSTLGSNHCFEPSGGGPNPNECHVISDTLLFESENDSAPFFPLPLCSTHPGLHLDSTIIVPTTATVVLMKFRSCLTFFLNQASFDEQACLTTWVLKYQLSCHCILTPFYRHLSSTTSRSTARPLRTRTEVFVSQMMGFGSCSKCPSAFRDPNCQFLNGPNLLRVQHT